MGNHTNYISTRAQDGYSLVELLIALVILAILATTAVVSYTEYSLRARVSGGIRLASPVKLAVSEYYTSHGEFPDSNSTAGVSAPETFADRDVRSVRIGTMPVTGTVIITYHGRGSVADGDSVLLVPLQYYRSVLWQCTSNTLVRQLLPAACRD